MTDRRWIHLDGLPAGWQLVPVTLTKEMRQAFIKECDRRGVVFGYPADVVPQLWHAVIGAAPGYRPDDLNHIRIDLLDLHTVRVSGWLDARGLNTLEAKIKDLKMLLDPPLLGEDQAPVAACQRVPS